MHVTAHKQGTPSWFELSTTDQPSALEFYAALFGWRDDPQPVPEGEPYHIQRKGEDSVAAISGQMPDEAAQGVPPHWNVYLSVDDLDAVAGKVEAAGGQVVMPPFDVTRRVPPHGPNS
jgi:predicted enzyme related to lactoylglutathione lyase